MLGNDQEKGEEEPESGGQAGEENRGKKSPAKRKSRKKDRDGSEVRQECSKLVKQDATRLTAAVIEEARKGQIAPVKYLFEMANIFPSADDGSQTSAKEESLAETLLRRLGIPTDPVMADEYEKEDEIVIPARAGDGAETTEGTEQAIEGGSGGLAEG